MIKFRCKYYKDDTMTLLHHDGELKITIHDDDNSFVNSVILTMEDIAKLKKELEKMLEGDE